MPSLTLVAFGLTVSLVALGLLTFSQSANALPPAGTDTFGVSAHVSIESALGSELIPLTGVVTIQRDAPHVEDGDDVQDLHITALSLSGLSATGFVTIAQSPTVPSTGELRSLGASEFPASSFFDMNVEANIPASGSTGAPNPFTVRNETVLHLIPMSNGMEAVLNSWPPFDVKFQQTPDPCIRMLRNVLDPRSQDPWLPQRICVTDVSVQLGQPPTPTATSTPCPGVCPTPTQGPFTSTRTPSPTRTPTRTPTPFGPEDPTFSVARGGPSGFHPAALLQLRPGSPPPSPTPTSTPAGVIVSGNDDFADAFQISSLPFIGSQSTAGFGVEANEPRTTPPPDDPSCILVTPYVKGATAWYRFTATTSGSITMTTLGSLVDDTVLAVYTGATLSSLTERACNDDDTDPETGGFHSTLQLSVTAGTVYYIQAGGFAAEDGAMRLDISGVGGAGAGNSDISVALTCAALGLSPDGCDNGADGDQDDLDALSFGDDVIPDQNPIAFSVAPGSQGLAGSGAAAQAACSPPEPQADEFTSSRDGTNTLVLDGDSQGAGCPGAFGLGLMERPTSDNLDALDGHRADFVDEDRDGQLDRAVYFSLAPGSPSLSLGGRSPADIFWTIGIGSPGTYVSHDQLGLQTTDDIDGLCLVDRGNEQARYDPSVDSVLFSLKAGSPALATLHASAADVLAPGPVIRYHAAELGLRSADDLDAMKCFQTSGSQSVKVAVGEDQSPTLSFWYCDSTFSGANVCQTKVNVGDTVEWNWVGTAPHTVTACGASCNNPASPPLFDSGVLHEGGHFEFTFNTPGTYPYYCVVHGASAQMGRIIVNAPTIGTPTSTPPGPTATRTPTRTPTPTGLAGDANKDGRINAIDATLVLQYSAGLLPAINQRADANGNGQINSIDSQLILQFVAGLLQHLPP